MLFSSVICCCLFVIYCFLFSSFYGLVLWGWSLLPDSTLSWPSIANIFNNYYNNNINGITCKNLKSKKYSLWKTFLVGGWDLYNLSGHMGKVVASHAMVAHSSPAEVALIYTMHEALRGYCPWGVGRNQPIGSTISDTIVHSWLWLIATRSSPLGCFSTLLQIVDNWTHILW